MEPMTGVFILLSILGTVAICGILKKVVKILVTAVVIISIVLGLFTILLYNDVTELSQRFPTEDKLFLMDIEGEIATGFVVGREGTPPVFLGDVTELNTAYENMNYPEMLGSNYIMFIFKEEDLKAEEVELAGHMFEKDFVIEMIKSQSPKQMFNDKLSEINGGGEFEVEGAETEEKFKALLFSSLFAAQQDDLFTQLKTVFVYPQATAFRFIKYIPTQLTDIIMR